MASRRVFSQAKESLIQEAFKTLSLDSPEIRLDDFVASTLGLNASQRATAFTSTDPSSANDPTLVLDSLAGLLDTCRRNILSREARIPKAVLVKREDEALGRSDYAVAGLQTYLRQASEPDSFIDRIAHVDAVRSYLAKIGDGFRLELLASCLLQKTFTWCGSTQRSADQGVDCLATQSILELQSWCCQPDVKTGVSFVGERLHVIASCKANEANISDGIPATISPAHIRELIGGWLIQRSDAGVWRQAANIKMLSAIQLLLVTTYRLSDESLSLCRDLGVAVWGIPELIYLICKHSPDSVFPCRPSSTFDSDGMSKWIDSSGNSRLSAS